MRLLEKYKTCLAEGRIDDAKGINEKICSCIRFEHHFRVKDLKEYARAQQGDECFAESIALYNAAAVLYRNEDKERKSLEGMRLCVGGIHDASQKLIEANKIAKTTMQNHVVPVMRKIKDDMEKVATDDNEMKCKEVVDVLRFISFSKKAIGEYANAETFLKESLTRMEKTHQKEVEKCSLYGRIYEDIGDLHLENSRTQDARSSFERAIHIYGSADDFSLLEEREGSKDRCRRKMIEQVRCFYLVNLNIRIWENVSKQKTPKHVKFLQSLHFRANSRPRKLMNNINSAFWHLSPSTSKRFVA